MRINKRIKRETKVNKYNMGGMPQGAPPPGMPGMGGGGAPKNMPPELMAALMGGGKGKPGPGEGGSMDDMAEEGAMKEKNAKFKKAINFVEASGNMDYSLGNKSGSSAVGPYQIMFSVHKDELKKMFGVNSREEFMGNEEAQEGYMDYLINEAYPRQINAIKKYYGPGGTKLKDNQMDMGILGDLTDNDLMALEHFLGHRDLMNYFAHIREGKKKDFKVKGKNLSVDEYLKRFNSSLKSVKERPATEEAGPTGMGPGGPPMGPGGPGGPGGPPMQFMGGGQELPPGLSV